MRALRPDDRASHPTGRPEDQLTRRLVALGLTALVLYGLAPAILEVLGAWHQLDDLQPLWWLVVLATQAGGLICFFVVQRVALHGGSWFAIATSNLTGGALGRIIPGGAATAAAVQYRMLSQAGVDRARIATGLTAGSLLLLAALAALPVLAVPFVVAGLDVPQTLADAGLLAGGVFVVLFALGALLFGSDRAVRLIGRVAAAVVHRVRGEEAARDIPARLVRQRDLVRSTLGRQWPEAIAAAIGRWLLDFLTLVAALQAAGTQPNLALVLLAYCAAQLLAQFPITPGGLGVVEAGMTATLALAGVPAGAAAIGVLAYRLASYWLQLPAGLVAWILHRRRYGSSNGDDSAHAAEPMAAQG